MPELAPLIPEYEQYRSAQEALPDDGQCPACLYFDLSHPDVRRILSDRDPTHRTFSGAQCKCKGWEEMRQRDVALREAQATLPRDRVPRTFENFDGRPGTEEMVAAARRFVNRSGPKMLVLAGISGTGKTHLLEAIGRLNLEAGRTTRYDMAATFLNRLRHTFDSDRDGDDLHDLLSWYNSRDTLLLDDVGLEKGTDFAREQLPALIETRLQTAGWIVVTTNQTKDQMADHLGDRMASRIWATNPNLKDVQVVVNTAEDYRP